MSKFTFKSQAEIEALTEENQIAYFKEVQAELINLATKNAEDAGQSAKEIAALKEQIKGYDVSRMATLIETAKAQGEAISEILKGGAKSSTPETMSSAIAKAIAENIGEIKTAMKSNGSLNLTSNFKRKVFSY